MSTRAGLRVHRLATAVPLLCALLALGLPRKGTQRRCSCLSMGPGRRTYCQPVLPWRPCLCGHRAGEVKELLYKVLSIGLDTVVPCLFWWVGDSSVVASQLGGGLRATRPGTVPWQHMELGRGWPPFVTETSSLTVPLACGAAALVLTVRATLVFLDHGKGTCCLQRAASLQRPKSVCGCPRCSILWPTGESVGQRVPEGNSMRAGTRSHGPGSPGDAHSLGGQGPGTHWLWPYRHAGLEHGCGSVGIVTGVWWGQGPCRSGHSGKVERSGHLLSCGHLGGLCVGLCPIAWRPGRPASLRAVFGFSFDP